MTESDFPRKSEIIRAMKAGQIAFDVWEDYREEFFRRYRTVMELFRKKYGVAETLVFAWPRPRR